MKARSISIASLAAGSNEGTERAAVSDAADLLPFARRMASGLGTPGDYLLVPENRSYPVTRRLVVLVPASSFDVARLGVTIGKIALPGKLSILFLALASDPELDSSIQRRLSTLAWLAKDRQVETSARLVYRENWIQALKEILREGDLVVCLGDRRTPAPFFPGKALAPRLVAVLRIPVYVLTGIYVDQGIGKRGRWRNLLIWVSAIAVLILFGVFQVFIERNLGGFMSTLAISLSVILEVFIIFKLNFLD